MIERLFIYLFCYGQQKCMALYSVVAVCIIQRVGCIPDSYSYVQLISKPLVESNVLVLEYIK